MPFTEDARVKIPAILQNGDDEFRPDITLLINGLPLIFTEVKKPNNRDGILAERHRINARFRNPKFRRFVNLTQLLAPEDPATEDFVLADNNLASIKHSPEFATNKNPLTPTNRLSTSLFSRDRLAFLLRFAFAYVRTDSRLEKHVMRYPQLFATLAIIRVLAAGIRKGIIWHTQGSGETALAFFAVHYLTDWFRRQGVVPKFYFIVDRIDLLQQASREFRSRGLVVHTINSRQAFARDIKSASAIHNDSGQPEITVVNIQKFQDNPDVVRASDYNISLQRVYFLDEVHRSYNPQGSFLANLNESDTRAIKIGLTGTPLIGDHQSKALFGNYIHKYYYNASIADGYALRLIVEQFQTRHHLPLTPDSTRFINALVLQEYLNEFNGQHPA